MPCIKTWDLLHSKQILYHWAITLPYLISHFSLIWEFSTCKECYHVGNVQTCSSHVHLEVATSDLLPLNAQAGLNILHLHATILTNTATLLCRLMGYEFLILSKWIRNLLLIDQQSSQGKTSQFFFGIIWFPLQQHTYCSWPWIRHSSLVGNPLVVRSISMSIWTQEYSSHISHAEHAHCWSFEDVARYRNSGLWGMKDECLHIRYLL